MDRRAAGNDCDALGLPRLHDPRANVPVGPSRANRPLAGAPGRDPRADPIDPPTELRDPRCLDPRPWLPLHPRPAAAGRPLLPPVPTANPPVCTRVGPSQ